MYIITIIQVAALFFSLYKNYSTTGVWMVPLGENPMLGPYSGTLITLGARFLPCMRETEYSKLEDVECLTGIKSHFHDDPKVCSLADYCSFGMKPVKNQINGIVLLFLYYYMVVFFT